MKIDGLTIHEVQKLLNEKKISASELTAEYFKAIKVKDGKLHCYLTLNEEQATQQAAEYDKNPDKFKDQPLAGIPISIKDVFCTRDLRTTCASKILDKFIPQYDSTVTQKLKDAGAINLGKTNLDDFCEGSSTETSAYGPTLNPHDTNRLPGGSSGGSAAAVAANLCIASVGTETAGSIRQPASWCGIVGLKPTYGRVSRHGVIAMGSSLDSPGPLTRDVTDAAFLLEIIAGKDPKDGTSVDLPVEKYSQKLDAKKIKGMKIGIPKEYEDTPLEDGVRDRFNEAVALLEKLGAKVSRIQLLEPKIASAVYTVICRSEVSSNSARYVGTRYSSFCPPEKTIADYYMKVRQTYLGEEPKRRIMTGTFALSAGYYDAYYKRGDDIRKLIAQNLDDAFKNVDLIFSPTTPTVAMKVGATKGNPLFGEIADIFMEASSLSQVPGISIPFGESENMPVGVQFFGPKFSEMLVLNAGFALEQARK